MRSLNLGKKIEEIFSLITFWFAGTLMGISICLWFQDRRWKGWRREVYDFTNWNNIYLIYIETLKYFYKVVSIFLKWWKGKWSHNPTPLFKFHIISLKSKLKRNLVANAPITFCRCPLFQLFSNDFPNESMKNKLRKWCSKFIFSFPSIQPTYPSPFDHPNPLPSPNPNSPSHIHNDLLDNI